jgi:hypothetical protein
LLRKIFPFTTVAFLVAALYVGWTFYSRHEANRHAQEELDAKQAAARKNVVDQYFGSGEIRIPTFLAAHGVLKAGETTQLCYGVVNAVSVKLDPPVETLKPTYRHCIDIAPKKTTTYTLTAVNAAGKSKSVSLEVRVER